MKLFTKSQIFTSWFDFDQNQSDSKKKNVQQCLFVGLVKKNELRPGLVSGGEGGVGLDKNC